jgi:hypothetical protein
VVVGVLRGAVADELAVGPIGASVPPLTTRSTPRLIVRRLCWSASSPPAPSAITTPDGPLMPYRIEIWPVVAA